MRTSGRRARYRVSIRLAPSAEDLAHGTVWLTTFPKN